MTGTGRTDPPRRAPERAFALRWRLLRHLRDAGPPLLTVICSLRLIQALFPAAVALAAAALVGAVGAIRQQPESHVWLPLAAYLALVLSGYVTEAIVEPFQYLATARIDGTHRAAVARWTAGTTGIAELESAPVQDLVRLASAEPESGTERTPGDGALAQLALLFRLLAAVLAGLVLLSLAWWPLPVLVAAAWGIREVSRRRWGLIYRLQAARASDGRIAGYWRETLTSPATGREVRIFGFGDWAVDRMISHTLAKYGRGWERYPWVARGQVWVFLLMAAPLGLVYGLSAYDTVGGRLTVAAEVAVLAAALAIYNAVYGVGDTVAIQGAAPVLEASARLERLLAPADERPVAGRAPAAGPPTVELHGLRFRYPGATRPILDGVDLRIAPGEMLAIVGLNGAGKSTLIKLLAGLYVPTSGTITIDGVDLREYGVVDWRRRLAVVFQDFVRYRVSAAENVALGRDGGAVARADLAEVARQAGLDEVVAELPDNWHTPLSRDRTGGVDLSGGQWQLVALARALLAVRAGAGLLVLDEPTAHLDVRTEADLFARLLGRAPRVSVLLISHRLATVRRADRIAVLGGGRITESGSHDELMASGGTYAAMFRRQAERFAQGHNDRYEATEF